MMHTQKNPNPDTVQRRIIGGTVTSDQKRMRCPLCDEEGGQRHLYRHLQTAHRKSEICEYLLEKDRNQPERRYHQERPIVV
jgi:hypothetical protein